ncbi:MAG: glycosyl transferase family protein [Rhodobacteraceae bacterium]|nr:glycosyl transferase family protein [Paracoccaceae bacterium]
MSKPIHPFARYVAILGRGKTKQRHLTVEEATDAMAMILRGEAEPEQIGAFLMLLRLKEESPGEIAGFTLGTKSVLKTPDDIPQVDLDWSSYAGKRRQLPWFLLSAILLSQNGVRVMMHGSGEHTPGRVYTDTALEYLGFPVAKSLEQAAEQIAKRNFGFIGLTDLCAPLQKLMDLKPILGLRSPVNSFSRMINPFNAPVMLQGIFHRGFMEIHTGAGLLLDQPVTVVFRGEGGEIERRPNKPTMVGTAAKGQMTEEVWPQLLEEGHIAADLDMDLGALVAVWRGAASSEYAEASVTGTLAIALKALGKADSVEAAQTLAQEMWDKRNKTLLPLAG